MERDVQVMLECFEFDCVDQVTGEMTKESGSSNIELARAEIERIESEGRRVEAAILKTSYFTRVGSGPAIDPLEISFPRNEFDELNQDFINKALADGLAKRQLVR
ncbi:MAG: hypothetical protein IPK01_16735 [Acidobacteria bacterium]|nr:hypothetical protein [Acidobacteriota bacterium]